MRSAFAFLLSLIVAGCGSSETDTPGYAPSYGYSKTSPSSVPEVTPTGENLEAAYRPSHYYDSRDGLIYSYIAAISEDDRKAGKAAGNVVSFAYLGMRGDKHVLARVMPNGSVLGEAFCGEPCRVISYPDGSQIAFTEGSVIGAAFADAIAGRLEVASYVSPTPRGTQTPMPTLSGTAKSTSEAPDWTAEEAQLISEWMVANNSCRSGTDPERVKDACANRDNVFGPALAAQNICYGRLDEVASQNVMHRCEQDSIRIGD